MLDFEFLIFGIALFGSYIFESFLFLISLAMLSITQFIFFALGFAFNFSEPLEFYLYIGITSLCLYSITEKSKFQDGKLAKMTKMFLWKIQKCIRNIKFLWNRR